MFFIMRMDKIKKIIDLLKGNKEGMTITEIVLKSDFSRSTVRTILARLEGAERIGFRRIGMAKVYTLK